MPFDLAKKPAIYARQALAKYTALGGSADYASC
jgi:hypothetical protein